MIDSERTNLIFKERDKMADISQVNMEEMVRKYGEEEAVRLIKVIMENNVTMLKLQNKYWSCKWQQRKRKENRKIGNKEEESMKGEGRRKNKEDKRKKKNKQKERE